jgi:hypothetical protein
MTDREIMQQALDALESVEVDGTRYSIEDAISALQERLAHCDRCGKRLGGEGDIHTCTPKPEQKQWDAIPDAFNEWWDADYDDAGNSYCKDSPAYWAWAGWSAAIKEKNT